MASASNPSGGTAAAAPLRAAAALDASLIPQFLVRVAEVNNGLDAVATQLADEFLRGFRIGMIVEADAHALGCECTADGGTDAARATGYQGDFSLKVEVHGYRSMDTGRMPMVRGGLTRPGMSKSVPGRIRHPGNSAECADAGRSQQARMWKIFG